MTSNLWTVETNATPGGVQAVWADTARLRNRSQPGISQAGRLGVEVTLDKETAHLLSKELRACGYETAIGKL